MLNDFKAFIMRGNIFDLAVGVIIGGAFGKIVTSLVNDILTPLLGILLGGVNLSDLHWTLGDAPLMYGAFIQSIIDFLIISASIFLFIRFATKFKKQEKAEPPAEPVPTKEELLLTEIRDLLKKQA
jgi:large conductance mechanosensitive channel